MRFFVWSLFCYSVLCVLCVLKSYVFRMFCDSQCYVALPHGVVGWSAVCDCGFLSKQYTTIAVHDSQIAMACATQTTGDKD